MLQIECTDTFSGEANYSWVRRYWLDDTNCTPRQIILAAKGCNGLIGTRCKKSEYGDMIELRPQGCNMVVFITQCEREYVQGKQINAQGYVIE